MRSIVIKRRAGRLYDVPACHVRKKYSTGATDDISGKRYRAATAVHEAKQTVTAEMT
jgi:hypothetical protein